MVKASVSEMQAVLRTSNGIHVDLAISAPSEQGVTISRPLEGHTPWDTGLRNFLVSKLIQHVLVLQIPDLDAGVGGGAQPVVFRGETHCIDSAVCI